MNKIAVIGCGGAGKSMFSIEIGKLLSLPVHHLDRLFWKSSWLAINREDFVSAQEDIFATDRWLIDGNYGGTMNLRIAQADTIIFLDLPTYSCLWAILKRYFKYRGTNRPDMTKGNRERITGEFFSYVLLFRLRRRPAIMGKLELLADSKLVICLKSRTEISRFLTETARNSGSD